MNFNCYFSEQRLILPEELKSVEEIKCRICSNLMTSDKSPSECTSCKNELYCEACLTRWKQMHNSCPSCKKANFKFVCSQSTLRMLISLIKIKCKNHEFGCETISSAYKILEHEKVCTNREEAAQGMQPTQEQDQQRAANVCVFCGIEVMMSQHNEKTNVHICGNYQLQQINRFNKSDFYFSYGRFKIRTLAISDQFKCGLCQNLVRDPRWCISCKQKYCLLCIANRLLIDDYKWRMRNISIICELFQYDAIGMSLTATFLQFLSIHLMLISQLAWLFLDQKDSITSEKTRQKLSLLLILFACFQIHNYWYQEWQLMKKPKYFVPQVLLSLIYTRKEFVNLKRQKIEMNLVSLVQGDTLYALLNKSYRLTEVYSERHAVLLLTQRLFFFIQAILFIVLLESNEVKDDYTRLKHTCYALHIVYGNCIIFEATMGASESKLRRMRR